MANTLLTISKITNEALMVLENSLTFTSEVERSYDDQFAVVGAKIGNTLNVRKPGRFIGTTGPALNVEDFNETSVPVTLSTQFHVDTQFTTQDLALSLDMFSDRVLKPAIAAIANKIDRDGLIMAKNSTANPARTRNGHGGRSASVPRRARRPRRIRRSSSSRRRRASRRAM